MSKDLVVNKNEPYTLLLDTENLSINDIKSAEDQIKSRRLFVPVKKAFERSNFPIKGKKRALLEKSGYRFVDIGETDAKNAVDDAIKKDAWQGVSQYQRHFILVSCDGGFTSTIKALKQQGVKVFLPRLKHASIKLKSIRHNTETIESTCWRTDSSKLLLNAIEAVKRDLGSLNQSIKCHLHKPEYQRMFEPVVQAMLANPVLCVNGWLYPNRLIGLIEEEWAHAIMIHLKHRQGFRCQKIPQTKYLIATPEENKKPPMAEREQKLKVAHRIVCQFDSNLPRPSKTNKRIRQALIDIAVADPNTLMFMKLFENEAQAANMIAAVLAFDEQEHEEFIYRQIRPVLDNQFGQSQKALAKLKKGHKPGKKLKRPVVAEQVKKFCAQQAKASNRHLALMLLHSDLERMCESIGTRFFKEHPEHLTLKERFKANYKSASQVA